MDQGSQVNDWDRLIGKYVSVWIWSIILGSSATITYTLPRPQEFFDYGTLGPFLLAIYLMVGVVALMALFSSLQFFRRFILPCVLIGEDADTERQRRSYEMTILYWAASYLVVATFLRVVLGLAMAAITIAIA